MVTNPVHSFTSLTVSAFELPIAEVWRGLERIFAAFGFDMAQRPGPVSYERYGPDPNPGGRGQRRGALLPCPRSGRANGTLMITNLIDGWTTLATRASSELACRCWQFTICQDVQFPRRAFHLMERGETRRFVSVMLDGGWEFAERGPPLSFEPTEVYTARRVKDRLTREHVLALAAAAGFPIGEDHLWTTAATSITFEDRHAS